jgi:hypothetical protein
MHHVAKISSNKKWPPSGDDEVELTSETIFPDTHTKKNIFQSSLGAHIDKTLYWVVGWGNLLFWQMKHFGKNGCCYVVVI